MKKKLSFLSVFVFLLCFNTYSQHFDVGFKFDLIKIIWYEQLPPYAGVHSITAFPAIFLKLGFLPGNNFELELDGGYQFGDKFSGFEGAILVKYEIWDNISPFAAYLVHVNADRVAMSGINLYNLKFFGAGAEWRLTEIFSVDIGYYYPVGEKGFDISSDELHKSDDIVFTKKISSFLKFGINFSFYH
jgi:hypothetical protein